MKNQVYYLVKSQTFGEKKLSLGNIHPEYVRVCHLYCGVCGSDLSHFRGVRGKFPISLGHEFISEVLDVNSDKTTLCSGDLVVSDFNFRCNDCDACKKRLSHLCVQNDIQFFSNRAFAQFSDIHYSYLFKVNELKSIKSGTVIEPLSCVLHATNEIKISPDDKVLLIGCGNIGTSVALYFFTKKNQDQIKIYDKIENKSKVLSEIFDYDTSSRPYKNEYDIVIDTSNHISGLELSTSCCRPGGQVISISHHYGSNVSVAYDTIIEKEIKISFPLRNGEPHNMEKAYEIIKNCWKKDYDILFGIHRLENIRTVFEQKLSYKENKIILSV